MAPSTMEVLTENFEVLLPEIERNIQQCDFISFDTELTGIDLGKDTRLDFFDEPADRYAKVRAIASAFTQYTFYVFQRAYKRRWPDVRFTCQSTSIEFLAKHHMDFNKVFHHGVSYLTRDQESSIRKEIDAAVGHSGEAPIPLGDQQPMIDAMCEQLDKWLGGAEDAAEAVLLGAGNAFQRKLQYQELERRYGGRGLVWEAREDPSTPGRKRIHVRRSGDEDGENEAAARAAALAAVDRAVGLRKVVDAVAAARKPLVGHNMLTDLLITYAQFIGPLPTDYDGFKAALATEFPVVYDTKYLASAIADVRGDFGDSTALGDVYARVQSWPYRRLTYTAPGGAAAHDAGMQGWDAYATGVVFAEIACAAARGDTTRAGLDTPALMVARNRLFCMRSDYPYLALDGPEPSVDRGAVLYVSKFGATTKTSHLREAFREAGAQAQIRWINDTSAFATLANPELARAALEKLKGREDMVVCEYASYHDAVQASERLAKRMRTGDAQ